ncbi:MAG: DUF3501 family protein [Proteobacteria bacterium]|nr:DUF3501 family protein [Pseudomonadota bacterium]
MGIAEKMLERKDLWSLEDYASLRNEFRAEVLAHKKHRNILIGEHVLLTFEDEKTIRYQIQEMLRIEKVFEAAGIQEELDAYNPLIPDGDNWKCTMLIQYADVEERRQRLAELIGIEDRVWMQAGDTGKLYAIADEDMDRDNEEKTSSVHFLRFQLESEQIAAVKAGEPISIGIDHDNYPVSAVTLEADSRASLAADIA